MALSVPCTGCDSVYPVPEDLLGKTIRCKNCKTMILVAVAKPTKSTPAAKSAVVVDDDEADRPAKPSRRRAQADEDDERPVKASSRRQRDEDEDEDDERPRRDKAQQKSKLPLILGGLAALLVCGGVGAAVFLNGPDGGNKPDEVAVGNPAPVSAPAEPAKKPTESAEAKTPPASNKVAGTPPETKTTPAEGAKPMPGTGEAEKKGSSPNAAAAQQTETKPMQTKPQVEPMEIGRGGRATSSGVSDQDVMDGRIPQTRQEAALAASVFIKCETAYGASTGSGWFGVEPGLVFTNAHVLDMKSPNSPEPKKLTFFLNSGKDNQREIPHSKLKILAVDHEMDLAVIQIIGEDKLPTPLQVKPSADLKLGQIVFTVGFPLGYKVSQLAKSKKEPEVMWRRTSFSGHSRRNGELRDVKLEGGVTSGNSGGAIVDATGEVVAVVVATTTTAAGAGNTIGLAIPTEYVKGMIAGRVATVDYRTPYKDKDQVKIPVVAKVLNPLKKNLTVRVRGWVADASEKVREPGMKRPESDPNDAGANDVELTYDPATQTAKGEIVLPLAPAGRGYFAQPYYVNAYTTYAMPGMQIPMTGPPVDRVATNLTPVRKEGSKRVATLSTSRAESEYHEGEEERKEEKVLLKTTFKVNETVIKADTTDPQQTARLRIQFESMNLGIEANEGAIQQQSILPKEIQLQLNEIMKKVAAYGLLNKHGEMYNSKADPFGAQDVQLQLIVSQFTKDALSALVVTSIPMPNKQVEPGETWTGVKDITGAVIFGPRAPGGPMGKPQPPRIREFKYRDQITYRYIGVRERAGRKEALVEIEGKTIQAPGSRDSASGTTKGLAWVEIETGVVLKAKIDKDFEVDTSRDGQKKKFTGVYAFEVDRGAAQ